MSNARHSSGLKRHPYAASTLDKDGYKVFVEERLKNAPELLAAALSHELQHILDGHHVLFSGRRGKREHRGLNLALDVVINGLLPLWQQAVLMRETYAIFPAHVSPLGLHVGPGGYIGVTVEEAAQKIASARPEDFGEPTMPPHQDPLPGAAEELLATLKQLGIPVVWVPSPGPEGDGDGDGDSGDGQSGAGDQQDGAGDNGRAGSAREEGAGEGTDEHGDGHDGPQSCHIEVDPDLSPDDVLGAWVEVRRRAEQAGIGPGRPQRGPLPPYQPPTTAARLAVRLTKAIEAMGSRSLVRTRTWARPGRLSWLRGSGRRPTLDLVVILDVSGSMAEHLGHLFGLASWCDRSGYRARWILFSDGVVYDDERTPRELPAGAGGGTCILPALRAASDDHADAVIIYTDGEWSDAPSADDLPRAPIIWVLPPYGRQQTIPLRPGDRVLVEERE
jgi:hypothetical protein